MGAIDFRVGGRIFATLASAHLGYGNLSANPECQRLWLMQRPDIFLPIAIRWGRMGMTHIRLAEASEDDLRDALQIAWQLRHDKNRSGRKKQ